MMCSYFFVRYLSIKYVLINEDSLSNSERLILSDNFFNKDVTVEDLTCEEKANECTKWTFIIPSQNSVLNQQFCSIPIVNRNLYNKFLHQKCITNSSKFSCITEVWEARHNCNEAPDVQ